MRLPSRSMVAAVLLAFGVITAQGQVISPEQRTEIERIIRNFLMNNSDVLQEALAEIDKKLALADAEKQRITIKENAEELFNSRHHVVIGNLHGDVTLVEFFDYNCGFCKRALEDMLTLMKSDLKLRVVLKELPVLGEGSADAARIAVAVRMQDTTGKKYLEFHQKLLTGRGQVDKERALAVAQEAGLDMTRLERDLANEEVRLSLEESSHLADKLGFKGTPSYVVGDAVVVGAVGVAALREKVNTARCGRATC